MPKTSSKNTEKEKYTYADYLKWNDGQRWELIHGEAYDMSPAPNESHQSISGELFGQIRDFLKSAKKPCKAYSAPFDVRFPEGVRDDDKISDVVQPDVVVICDRSKIDRRGCNGAPDFIIEILSPSTLTKDIYFKRDIYEKNGVKEYWIIDPAEQVVIIYLLGEDKKYGKPEVRAGNGKLKSVAIEGLEIDLDDVFKAPLFGQEG